jgi:steroid Delta-isomerase
MTKEEINRWLSEYRDSLKSMVTDRWVGHYAPDAIVEDPVGGPEFKGHEQLRAFFEGVREIFRHLEMFPEHIIETPPEAAVKFYALAETHAGKKLRFEGISTYIFNEDGKLSRMRAYWNAEELAKKIAE